MAEQMIKVFIVKQGFRFDDFFSGVTHYIPEGVKIMYDFQEDKERGTYIHLFRADSGMFYDISGDFDIDKFVIPVGDDVSDYPKVYPIVEDNVKKESPIKSCEDNDNYCSFIIANYALTDVIEALTTAKVKDIIVTKVDGNLVVKYKPYWRG